MKDERTMSLREYAQRYYRMVNPYVNHSTGLRELYCSSHTPPKETHTFVGCGNFAGRRVRCDELRGER